MLWARLWLRSIGLVQRRAARIAHAHTQPASPRASTRAVLRVQLWASEMGAPIWPAHRGQMAGRLGQQRATGQAGRRLWRTPAPHNRLLLGSPTYINAAGSHHDVGCSRGISLACPSPPSQRTSSPRAASANASCAEKVLLPTPPLPVPGMCGGLRRGWKECRAPGQALRRARALGSCSKADRAPRRTRQGSRIWRGCGGRAEGYMKLHYHQDLYTRIF